MTRLAAFVAALVTLMSQAASASGEGAIQIAILHPHPPQVQPAEARALFDDVNATRARRGLPALIPDAQLDGFALAVAQQMAERHYFGHTDPTGVTFEDRLRASGLRYRFAAENMALDQDERHAHAAFLHSPGHFANIVDPAPRKMGVAVVAAGDGELFYVEEFAD